MARTILKDLTLYVVLQVHGPSRTGYNGPDIFALWLGVWPLPEPKIART